MEYLTQASYFFCTHSSFPFVPPSLLLENLFCHSTPNSTSSPSLHVSLDDTGVSRRRTKRFKKPLSNLHYDEKLD
jgi:hypothetical protein